MAAALTVSAASFAQSKEKNEKDEKSEKHKQVSVPPAVKQSFGREYPGAKAKWGDESGKYEADFVHNGQEMSVLYNANGKSEEVEMEIPVTQLPEAVKSYLNHHKMGKIKEAAKITKANGEINYEAEVGGKDFIFDVNGKFLKETSR